jgi:serine phosphatase RsbU (regulator of sigma subunit)
VSAEPRLHPASRAVAAGVAVVPIQTTPTPSWPIEIAAVGSCLPSDAGGRPAGGDFFDVCILDDSRTMIAVGDVAGHGPEQAERMIELRELNRALALEGVSITEAVRELDVLLAERGLEALATMWLGVYNRTTDWLDYVSAGHPPPILGEADGRCRSLSEASAPPLGTGEVDRHVLADRARFCPGTLLVAYSDGLIERPGLDLSHQIEVLRETVADLYTPAMNQAGLERLIGRVLQRADSYGTVKVPDDVCILGVHRPLLAPR